MIKVIKKIVLTNKYVGHQGCRKTEDYHQYVSNSQVHNEEVGDGPHPRRPEHHSNDETVSDEADGKDDQISHTIHSRHG